MNAVLLLCAGFLMAVLWFDLMFDTLVIGAGAGELPETTLSAIAGYYARVTTGADPMGRLVGAVMAVTAGGTTAQLLGGWIPRAAAAAALALCTGPILLAGLCIFPEAVQLAGRADPAALQSELARSIFHAHLLCLASIAGFAAIQLWASRRLGARPRAGG